MLTTHLSEIIGTPREVDWGNGTSQRLLISRDGRGFTLTDTFVRPNTETVLRYDHHLEACYCISGSGEVVWEGGRARLAPDALYAPDRSEEHTLVAFEEGLRLICVFNPPLTGNETHDLSEGMASGYQPSWAVEAPR